MGVTNFYDPIHEEARAKGRSVDLADRLTLVQGWGELPAPDAGPAPMVPREAAP